ncbi:aKG-HExxH-type peptide beta-hydroxylase [Streptomyces sp. NPDC001568]|uniref:aKG-HExxH-type peptide beta-hydroxylase n=1 Tax=Streptomyces sp. NPDC001568 TaxID=3364588 RepID=UPI0036825854
MPRNLTEIDRNLGTDPRFGSADTIDDRNTARFRVGLRILAGRHPRHAAEFGRVGRLPTADLRRLLCDPVLRNAFERDLAVALSRPGEPSTLALMLRQAGSVADGLGPCEGLMDTHHQPWPALGPAWVWTSSLPEEAHPLLTALGRRRDDVFEEMGVSRRVEPDDQALAALSRGAELLAELLPHTGAGALRHVALVGFAEGEDEDGSVHSFACGDRLPSALFLSPHALTDPWKAAELLFHESLHLKMFDIMRTGALVSDIGRMTGTPPWRVVDWNLRRVYSSLHVYAHMVLFFAAAADAPADLRRRFGEPPARESVGACTPGSVAAAEGTYATSEERTRYLACQALHAHGDALTSDGRAMVVRLLDAVAPLVPGLPPTDRQPESPAPRSAPESAVLAHPDGYQQRRPITVLPIQEQGTLLAVAPGSSRMVWLNAHAWFVFALCDGRDLRAMEAAYLRKAPGGPSGLGNALDALLSAGLISPNAMPATAPASAGSRPIEEVAR